MERKHEQDSLLLSSTHCMLIGFSGLDYRPGAQPLCANERSGGRAFGTIQFVGNPMLLKDILLPLPVPSSVFTPVAGPPARLPTFPGTLLCPRRSALTQDFPQTRMRLEGSFVKEVSFRTILQALQKWLRYRFRLQNLSVRRC